MPLPKWEYMVFTGGTKILFDLGVPVQNKIILVKYGRPVFDVVKELLLKVR